MNSQFQELISWITLKKKLNQPISEVLDLVEEGILDSLLFAEYIMMIEDLSGVEIDVDDSLLDKVRTLSLVRDNYFSEN